MNQLRQDRESGNESLPKHFTVPPAAQNVVTGREAEILQHIETPGVAATIWKRKPATNFQYWVDTLPRQQLPELRVIIPVERVESAALAACDLKGLQQSDETVMLASDTGALAYIFGTIMNARILQLRLDVAAEVMCPKFHLDNVTARLLCTYRGPGTQYMALAEDNGSGCLGQLATGDVGIFRGRKWRAEEACTLLHRSPSIETHTGPRLFLAIDAIE